MLKGQTKHIDKEQGKTKHEAPLSVNYRATQNENNIGTTALERSVVYTTWAFPCTNFTLGPDIEPVNVGRVLGTKTNWEIAQESLHIFPEPLLFTHII